MPLFSQTSQIYSPDEVNQLRSCVEQAAVMFEKNGLDYDEGLLAEAVIRLYDSGLRDLTHLTKLAFGIAATPSIERKSGDEGRAANRNREIW